jgi:hypothetical protein
MDATSEASGAAMIDPAQERIASIRYRINQNIEAELAKLPPSPDRFRPSVKVWSFIRTIHVLNGLLWKRLEA